MIRIVKFLMKKYKPLCDYRHDFKLRLLLITESSLYCRDLVEIRYQSVVHSTSILFT